MMSFRSLAISLTFVSLALTFAVSSWQRGLWHGAQDSARARPDAATPAPGSTFLQLASAAPDVAAPAPPARTAPIPGAPRAPVATADAGAVATTESDTPPPQQQPVPVRIVFQSQPGGIGATLHNTSSEPLDITVTAMHPVSGSGSSIRLTVAPNDNVDLVANGLVLEHGSNVTISSAHYADRQMHAN